jgi:hypothetical protein
VYDFLSDALKAAIPPAPSDHLDQPPDGRLIIDDFEVPRRVTALGTRWQAFSDRVMGGVSDMEARREIVAGKAALRLTGTVTRDHGGGFIQLALNFAPDGGPFDARAFGGIELLVHGNGEQYNAHIRTGDVTWYEQSYRARFQAEPRWSRLRLPWAAFEPHRLSVPLDRGALVRIGLLGWMREFEADLAIGEIALFPAA